MLSPLREKIRWSQKELPHFLHDEKDSDKESHSNTFICFSKIFFINNSVFCTKKTMTSSDDDFALINPAVIDDGNAWTDGFVILNDALVYPLQLRQKIQRLMLSL